MSLSPLSKDAQRLMGRLGLNESLAVLQRAWEAEMGAFSDQARIVAIENRALIVEVFSSPALQEMSLRRRELLRRINRYFEDPFLHQITVKMTNGSAPVDSNGRGHTDSMNLKGVRHGHH